MDWLHFNLWCSQKLAQLSGNQSAAADAVNGAKLSSKSSKHVEAVRKLAEKNDSAATYQAFSHFNPSQYIGYKDSLAYVATLVSVLLLVGWLFVLKVFPHFMSFALSANMHLPERSLFMMHNADTLLWAYLVLVIVVGLIVNHLRNRAHALPKLSLMVGGLSSHRGELSLADQQAWATALTIAFMADLEKYTRQKRVALKLVYVLSVLFAVYLLIAVYEPIFNLGKLV